MARAIDAYTLNNDLVSWYNDTEDETEKSVLRRVMQRVVQAPTITPPNEALTLEELRGMDGEPVFVQWTDNRILPRWYIVGCYEWNLMDFDAFEDYGKWLAYRRPPEGEADA